MTIDAIPSGTSISSFSVADNLLPPFAEARETLQTTSDAIAKFKQAMDVSAPMIAAIIKAGEASTSLVGENVAQDECSGVIAQPDRACPAVEPSAAGMPPERGEHFEATPPAASSMRSEPTAATATTTPIAETAVSSKPPYHPDKAGDIATAPAVAEPSVKTVAEPPVKTVAEPAIKTVAEPPVKTVAEPPVKTVAEPPVKTVAEPATQTVAEPAAKTEEPIAQPDRAHPAIEPSATGISPERGEHSEATPPAASSMRSEPTAATMTTPIAETAVSSKPPYHSDKAGDIATAPAVAEPQVKTVSEPPVKTVAEPPEPSVKTVPEPSVKTVPEPSAKTVSEPSTNAVLEPATSSEPTAKTVAEPAAKTVAEPTAKTVAEPAARTVAEPTAKTAEQPAAKTEEPIAQPARAYPAAEASAEDISPERSEDSEATSIPSPPALPSEALPQAASAAAATSAIIAPEAVAEAAAKAASARSQEIVSAVESVAAAISVTPGLAHGDGEVRIVLKPTVLGGSEIKVEARGQSLQVSISPASAEVEQLVERSLPQFQQQLAERVAAFHNVSVAVTPRPVRSRLRGDT